MKKAFLAAVFLLGLFTSSISAQSSKPAQSIPVFTLSDSAALIGKYKYEGLPFEYMTVDVKEGKLHYSGGEYNGFLDPIKDKKDTFDAGGVAVFTFVRDNENIVKELRIDYQGQTYTGLKEEKKG